MGLPKPNKELIIVFNDPFILSMDTPSIGYTRISSSHGSYLVHEDDLNASGLFQHPVYTTDRKPVTFDGLRAAAALLTHYSQALAA